MNALVVESSKTMRSVLRRILTTRGFEVTEADDGRLALDVLHSMGTADLILVNWVPQETGSLEFITRLRHDATNGSIVIMLTAAELGVRELQRAFTAGADDYLIMPFTSQQFDDKLAKSGLTVQPGCIADRRVLLCR
jgi:two-component system chemotaxis response regulator CheY